MSSLKMTTPAIEKAGMRLSSIAKIISRATTARITVILPTTRAAPSVSFAMRPTRKCTPGSVNKGHNNN